MTHTINFEDTKFVKEASSENKNAKGVILLNKPFQGNWLRDGKIGHEVIDFVLDDSGNQYVYNNPYGQCPTDIEVGEPQSKTKYLAKYMVLTSAAHGIKDTKIKSFYVMYVIELSEKIHSYHWSSNQKKRENVQQSIVKLMGDKGIEYNGKTLDKIYGEDGLFLTFKAKSIYKATEPILFTPKNYNFQRNKGYLKQDVCVEDFLKMMELIEGGINSNNFENITLKKVNDTAKSPVSNHKKTFLDLIRMSDKEQAYTNMLCDVLKQDGFFNKFCAHFKGNKTFQDKADFKISAERKINKGRMDICGESDQQIVIIENKVYSGLNGIDTENGQTQLSVYYKWANGKTNSEPLCFVIAPNFRKSEIEKEISDLDEEMIGNYIFISYGDIAKFFDEERNSISKSYVYNDLFEQIISAFNNLSYDSKEDFYRELFLDAASR